MLRRLTYCALLGLLSCAPARGVEIVGDAGEESSTEGDPWEDCELEGEPCALTDCSACWGIENGVGSCKVSVHEASTEEMTAILFFASSAKDRCKAHDPEVARPLAEMLIEQAAAGNLDTLDKIKKLVRLPESIGYTELEGIEVRVQSGTNSGGECWHGLREYLYTATPDWLESCCTTPDCEGAHYRCESAADGGPPRPCEMVPIPPP